MSFLLLFQSGKSRLSSSRSNNAAHDGEEAGAVDLGILGQGQSSAPSTSESTNVSNSIPSNSELSNSAPDPSLSLESTVEPTSESLNSPPTKKTNENTGNISEKDGDITGSVTNT